MPQPAADEAQLDDAFSYNLGANYNAGWAKFFLYGQIFENYANAAKTTTFHQDSGVDGFGVNIGADVPLFGGTFKASFGYGDFEASRDSALSMKTCQTARRLYIFAQPPHDALYGSRLDPFEQFERL